MKRIMAILLCAALLLPSAAFADIVWEPDNDFYQSHREECETLYNWRSFIADAEGGEAPVFRTPGKPETGSIPNGEVLWGNTIYTDEKGGKWIFAEDMNGWANLHDFKREYDSALFVEEHSGEIAEEGAEIPNDPGRRDMVLWSYPRSGRQAGSIPGQELDGGLKAEKVYTDPDGGRWGYIGYFMGSRNAWVYLEDPFGETAPAAPHDPVNTGAPAYQPPAEGLPLPLVGGVLALAAAAAGMMMIRAGRKKKVK